MPTSCNKNLQVSKVKFVFSENSSFFKIRIRKRTIRKGSKRARARNHLFCITSNIYSTKNGIIIFCYTKLISTFTTCYKVHGGLKKDSNEITRILSSSRSILSKQRSKIFPELAVEASEYPPKRVKIYT